MRNAEISFETQIYWIDDNEEGAEDMEGHQAINHSREFSCLDIVEDVRGHFVTVERVASARYWHIKRQHD